MKKSEASFIGVENQTVGIENQTKTANEIPLVLCQSQVEIPLVSVPATSDQQILIHPENSELKRQKQLTLAKYYLDECKLDKIFMQAFEAIAGIEHNYDEFAPLIREITELHEFMMINLHELESDGWITDKESKGISVKYKFPAGTQTVSLMMEAEIDAEITKLLALIMEVELFPKYVPFCQRAYQVRELRPTQKVCASQLYFPFISNRETVFLGTGIDRLETNGSFIFLCKSTDQVIFCEFDKIWEIPKSKLVRLHLNYYAFELTPITKTRCRVRAVNNSDPKLKFLPASVVAFIARKFAFTLIEKMVKYANNFDNSPWKAKYDQNREFYKWIEDKVERHFE